MDNLSMRLSYLAASIEVSKIIANYYCYMHYSCNYHIQKATNHRTNNSTQVMAVRKPHDVDWLLCLHFWNQAFVSKNVLGGAMKGGPDIYRLYNPYITPNNP